MTIFDLIIWDTKAINATASCNPVSVTGRIVKKQGFSTLNSAIFGVLVLSLVISTTTAANAQQSAGANGLQAFLSASDQVDGQPSQMLLYLQKQARACAGSGQTGSSNCSGIALATKAMQTGYAAMPRQINELLSGHLSMLLFVSEKFLANNTQSSSSDLQNLEQLTFAFQAALGAAQLKHNWSMDIKRNVRDETLLALGLVVNACGQDNADSTVSASCRRMAAGLINAWFGHDILEAIEKEGISSTAEVIGMTARTRLASVYTSLRPSPSGDGTLAAVQAMELNRTGSLFQSLGTIENNAMNGARHVNDISTAIMGGTYNPSRCQNPSTAPNYCH